MTEDCTGIYYDCVKIMDNSGAEKLNEYTDWAYWVDRISKNPNFDPFVFHPNLRMKERNEFEFRLQALKQGQTLPIDSVSNRRELFNSFIKWIDYNFDQHEYTTEVKQHVDDYLKTIE